MADDGSGNGEVVYRVSTASEREGTGAGLRAVWVAEEIAGMISAGLLPGFGLAEADGCGRVRLVVDVVTAALIAQEFAQDSGAAV